MKLQKRFAAGMLAAVLALCMLTACGDTLPTDWQNSRTMVCLAKRGISAGNVSLTAHFTVNGENDETYISYYARDNKEYVVFYAWDAYGDPTPLLLICKYGRTYFTGAYLNEGGVTIQWDKGSSIEVEEFEYAKKLCKIPSGTETAQNYECKKTELNGQVLYVEHVTLDGMAYAYAVDQKGTLQGLQTQINGETYTVRFAKLESGPADSAFPTPRISS